MPATLRQHEPDAHTKTLTDPPLIDLRSDYAPDGQFGVSVLTVDAQELRVSDAQGRAIHCLPLHHVKSARHEPLVGGGRMEITTHDGRIIPVITYSLSYTTVFSDAARGIEQLAHGEQMTVNLHCEPLRCGRCGRLLPEKGGICPHCVHKGRTLLRISGFLTPYRWHAVGLAALGLVTTVLNLAPPYVQGSLIDQVLLPHRNLRLLWILMGGWLLLVSVSAWVQVRTGKLIAFLAANIASDLRARVFRAVEFLQLAYFDKKQVGAITSRITQDTDRVWGFLVDGLPYLVTNILLLAGIAIFLFHTNALLAACILAPIPLVLIVSVCSWRPVSRLYHRCGQKWARFHMHLNEALTGIRVVKAFAQEDREHHKFTARNDELRTAGIEADSRWYTVFGLMTFFTSLGALVNWTVGGYLVYTRQMTLGDFWKINAYLGLVYGPLQWFAQINNWFSRAMAGAERVFEVIDADSETGRFTGHRQPITGEVRFEAVRFGYDKSNPVLKGLSFTASPGEMIGLVGKSGAGKSTTINLICRFYQPDSGRILIDGIDYREIDLQSLRQQIGVVLQEPFLFHGTIAENIAYARPDASFAEIVESARAANAHEFILTRPDGYDTVIGERGARLSGGERQRLSIARAILHDPRILILDEATSSVDVETERQIQEAIQRLVAGRTTFAIAHRLSTLRNATRLIVLERGEIAEMGTHEELMRAEGHFYKLVQSQSALNEIITLASA